MHYINIYGKKNQHMLISLYLLTYLNLKFINVYNNYAYVKQITSICNYYIDQMYKYIELC